MAWNTLPMRMILALLLCLVATRASATASLSCVIEDGNVEFALFAATNREHGAIVSITESSLRLKSAALVKVAPGFAGALKIEQEHIIQQWFLGRELRIAINVDNEHGELLLTIIGQQKKSNYSGRYALKVSNAGNSRSVSGRIKRCTGDD